MYFSLNCSFSVQVFYNQHFVLQSTFLSIFYWLDVNKCWIKCIFYYIAICFIFFVYYHCPYNSLDDNILALTIFKKVKAIHDV